MRIAVSLESFNYENAADDDDDEHEGHETTYNEIENENANDGKDKDDYLTISC